MLILIFLLIVSASAEWSPKCTPCNCLVRGFATSYAKFTNLKTAECLWINSTSVPSDFPSEIQMIDIEGGNITSLAGTEFIPYKNLTHIWLRDNQLTDLPNSLFSNTINIQTIDFSKNKIKTLPKNLFAHLKHLEVVWMNRNQITSIDDNCFVNLPLLYFIDISHNRLTKINERFIDDLSSLKELHFYNNPVHCDETICELMNLVVNRKMYYYDTYIPTCETPGSVKGKTWPEAVEFLWGKGLERCPKARQHHGGHIRLTEGQKYAMLEMKVTFSRLLRHFEFESAGPNYKMDLEADVVMQPLNGIYVKIKPRDF